MPATSWFQKIWRLLFWLGVVIAALNIENLANALGMGNLLTSEHPTLSRIVAALLSDDALHVALFLTGGGAFAWGTAVFRRLDEGIPSLSSVALTTEQLADEYGGETMIGTKAFVDWVMTGTTQRLNKKLAKLDVSPVPLPDMGSKASRLHVSQYLHALTLHFRAKDLDGARKAAVLYLTNLESVGFVPRPLPDTEQVTTP